MPQRDVSTLVWEHKSAASEQRVSAGKNTDGKGTPVCYASEHISCRCHLTTFGVDDDIRLDQLNETCLDVAPEKGMVHWLAL